MTRWPIAASFALAVTSVAGAAGAQSQNPAQNAAPTQQRASVSSSDKSFMEDVTRENNSERALAKLAETRAQSDDVKSFARAVVTDHAKVDAGLMGLASKKGVDLADLVDHDEVTSGQQHTIARLSKLKGAEFDREFMAQMVKDHRDDVELFDKQLAKIDDADLKGWTEQTRDALRGHLKMAEDIQNRLRPAKE
jgi:putative membrane protein